MVSQLALKSRINSTTSLGKIFNAQEMIASSHISKARTVALNAKPYSDAIFDAVQALAAHTDIDHPIVKNRQVSNPQVAVLALTADRGMAGAYTSSVIRETEALLDRLDGEGKQPQLYVYGRRGISYYKYRGRTIADTWEGQTDHPGVEVARQISDELLSDYMKPAEKGGVSELYIVFTEFINMVVQKVRVLRMLPVQLVGGYTANRNEQAARAHQEAVGKAAGQGTDGDSSKDQITEATQDVEGSDENLKAKSVRPATPLYLFEPSLNEVLDSILPKYVQSRIHECLLTAAASETASRQNAMHTATDNANNLIDELTRRLNASRQASITQELTEIISSADALNKKEE